MLDFTVNSPGRFLNDLVSLAEPGSTARAASDRRAAKPGVAPAPGVARKRRRHDNLNSGQAAPLTW
ncbi:MAG: hypothetical protein JWR40_32 [Massilia sp.]|nr:hypothetical protein [Massilia sp.]MDB5952908.1 hypothetical protein [Massilia sp.]